MISRPRHAAGAVLVALVLVVATTSLIAGHRGSVALATPARAGAMTMGTGGGSAAAAEVAAGVHPLAVAPAFTGLPLRQPAVYRSRHGLLNVALVASERVVTIAGRRVLAKVYNGSWVAPTLQISPGDLVRVRLVDHLREPTNLHFHGLEISPDGHADNVFVTVDPGRSFQYAFRLPRDAPTGTFWYHSHLMAQPAPYTDANSEEQVFDGLSGLIEVRGLARDLPRDLAGLPQRYLALRDVQVSGGAIVSDDIVSNAATTRLIDGQYEPRMTIAPGQTQLWHIANIGADIFYRLALPGLAFEVIAQDGHPVVRPQRAATLVLPPGKRWDVLVTGGPRPGSTPLRTLRFDQGDDHYPAQTLATVLTAGPTRRALPTPRAIMPGQLNLARAPVARRRTLVFAENTAGTRFFIDGRSYDMSQIAIHARLGTVEQWTIVNHTDELHPFHLHTYPMQQLSSNGVPIPFDGYQDEIVLPRHGYVVIRVHFTGFTGTTVFHCHILAHEDAGMMANLEVTR